MTMPVTETTHSAPIPQAQTFQPQPQSHLQNREQAMCGFYKRLLITFKPTSRIVL